VEGETTGKEDENLCHFRHHNIDFVHKLGHLTPVEDNLRHLRYFQEAVNIDANFAVVKDVSADRLLHTKYLLNILFERM